MQTQIASTMFYRQLKFSPYLLCKYQPWFEPKKKKSNFDSTTYVFLQQAPTNKVLKDAILNWFIAKFSLVCRYNTGKTLLILILLVPFYTRVIRRSLLANKKKKK